VSLSWVRGSQDEPLMSDASIARWFERSVATYTNQRMLRVVEQDISWSWLELNEQIDAMARGLLSLGITKGSRVGIWMQNCSEWVVVSFACFKIGAVLVNVNPAYRGHELAFVSMRESMRRLAHTQTYTRSSVCECVSFSRVSIATMGH